MRIGSFNAQSMCNKVSGVLQLLPDNFLDILCLQETWLKSKDNSILSEIHDHGLEILSAPRRGRGGGVAMIFNPKTTKLTRNM